MCALVAQQIGLLRPFRNYNKTVIAYLELTTLNNKVMAPIAHCFVAESVGFLERLYPTRERPGVWVIDGRRWGEDYCHVTVAAPAGVLGCFQPLS